MWFYLLLFLFLFLLIRVVPPFIYRHYRLPRGPDLWDWSGIIIGHRGCRIPDFNIPENSMIAFEYARQHGAGGIEVDISLTKDGKIVVLHDGSIDRTHNGSGQVHEMTFNQIQAIQYKTLSSNEYIPSTPIQWPSTLLKNERIDRAPSLEQVIRYCIAHDLKLMIELKEWKRPALIRKHLYLLFEQYNLYQRAYVATFNPLHLYQLRCERPDLATCLLYCRDCTQWYDEEGSNEMKLPSFINCRYSRYILDQLLVSFAPTILSDLIGVSIIGGHNVILTIETVSYLRKKGVLVDVWVCNSPGEKLFWLENGCIVTTDSQFNKADEERRRRSIAEGMAEIIRIAKLNLHKEQQLKLQ